MFAKNTTSSPVGLRQKASRSSHRPFVQLVVLKRDEGVEGNNERREGSGARRCTSRRDATLGRSNSGVELKQELVCDEVPIGSGALSASLVYAFLTCIPFPN